MATTFGDKPFGLSDVKITPVTGSQVDVPIAQRLSFGVRIKGGELSGDDTLQAVAAFAEAIEWELEAGGISLDAYAVMMGLTSSSSGSTPSAVYTLNVTAAQRMPYFKIYGKSLGDSIDDVHVKIPKAKLTESIEGELRDGEFFVTSCSGLAVSDGTNLMTIVQNETATTLPAS
jgi:hypothetical protein